MRPRRLLAGYTLLELLTVLALVGILTSLAAPSLRDHLQRLRLRAALDRFTADLFHARALAARSGRELRLRFERGETPCLARYLLEDPAGRRTLEVTDLSRTAPGVCLTLRGSPRIRINPQGMPSGAARKLVARLGTRADSLSISLVGRVYRWERAILWGRAVAATFFRTGNHFTSSGSTREAKSMWRAHSGPGTHFSYSSGMSHERSPRPNAGYTMIELLTVLVVVGIVAALASPALGSYVDTHKTQRALDRISADLAYARMLAVRSGGATLRFEDEDSYVIEMGADDRRVRSVDLSREFPGVAVTDPASASFVFNGRGIVRSLGAGGSGRLEAVLHGKRESLLVTASGRVYRAY